MTIAAGKDTNAKTHGSGLPWYHPPGWHSPQRQSAPNPFESMDRARAYPEGESPPRPMSRLEQRWDDYTPTEKLARWNAVKFRHAGLTASKKRRIAELRKEAKTYARSTSIG